MTIRFHDLKILPQYFEDIVSGKKAFEVRYNDRGFSVGDVLVLREFIPETGSYTLRYVSVEITYILTDFKAITKGYVVMSIKLRPDGVF